MDVPVYYENIPVTVNIRAHEDTVYLHILHKRGHWKSQLTKAG